MVIGMRNTTNAAFQLEKSGRKPIWLGGILAKRPDRPPTAGCCSAKYATANVLPIVMRNWSESVTNTPHSPDTDAKKIVMIDANRSVFHIGRPNRMLPNLTAARFTVAMITQLKKNPR